MRILEWLPIVAAWATLSTTDTPSVCPLEALLNRCQKLMVRNALVCRTDSQLTADLE